MNQRDILLEILATGIPFTGDITLHFETDDGPRPITSIEDFTIEEIYAAGYVPKVTIDELNARIEARNNIIREAQEKIDRLERDFDNLDALHKELTERYNELHKKQPKPEKVTPKYRYVAPSFRRLSKNEVWDIRDYIKIGMTDKQICEKMGNKFKQSTVYRIRKNKAYKNVGSRPHKSTSPRPRAVAHAGHDAQILEK